MGTSLRSHVPRTPGMCLLLKDFKHRSDMARFAFEQDCNTGGRGASYEFVAGVQEGNEGGLDYDVGTADRKK